MLIVRTLASLMILASAAYAGPSPHRAEIRSVTVERPNLIVSGSYLSRVELHGVPSGTGITEGGILGLAKRRNSAGENETWAFPIPKEDEGPFTEIYADGLDTHGHKVARKYLPFVGVSNIYDALWGKPETRTPAPAN